MKTKRTQVNAFSARITIGTQIGYTDEKVSEADLVRFIQGYQDNLIQDKEMFLGVCFSKCRIILSGQVEPHFQMSFINYPKFPLDEKVLKEEIERFGVELMKKFTQNRIVVEFPKKTIMFEKSDQIDPRIKTR